MGFTRMLASPPVPLPRKRRRRSELQIAHIESARSRAADRNTPAPVTACLILELGADQTDLQYGDEVPIHFEVSPRPVGRDNLAVSRLEAMVEGKEARALCRGKDLILASAPASLGLVTAIRFRDKVDNGQAVRDRLAEQHDADLRALLAALDAETADPFLTDSKQRIAGTFLLGQFRPVGQNVRARFPRKPQQGVRPGWVLGLGRFARGVEILQRKHREEIAAIAKRARWITPRDRKDPEFETLALTAAETAISQAMAGFASDAHRAAAERRGDMRVASYAGRLAQDCLEVLCHTKSKPKQTGGSRDAAGNDAEPRNRSAEPELNYDRALEQRAKRDHEQSRRDERSDPDEEDR